jgi:hypothetical protein
LLQHCTFFRKSVLVLLASIGTRLMNNCKALLEAAIITSIAVDTAPGTSWGTHVMHVSWTREEQYAMLQALQG